MWIQDLKKAIAKFEKDFGSHLYLIDQIVPSGDLIMLYTSAGDVYAYSPKVDSITLIKSWRE